MLGTKRDLGDDHVNSDVVDHLSLDLLVERLTDGDSSIFRGGLKKAISFCEVRKMSAKRDSGSGMVKCVTTNPAEFVQRCSLLRFAAARSASRARSESRSRSSSRSRSY